MLKGAETIQIWRSRFLVPFTLATCLSVRYTEHEDLGDLEWCVKLFGDACRANATQTPRSGSLVPKLWAREKPRVIETGPYARVRDPGYSSVLLQQALWSIMFSGHMYPSSLLVSLHLHLQSRCRSRHVSLIDCLLVR
ncbi:hypothetical protein J3R83DRAFT_12505 [Lanmaoa asiatica]|nr:hypothetical protein J3R83DRAFT_12505 [Lanmaoa asiatica]